MVYPVNQSTKRERSKKEIFKHAKILCQNLFANNSLQEAIREHNQQYKKLGKDRRHMILALRYPTAKGILRKSRDDVPERSKEDSIGGKN